MSEPHDRPADVLAEVQDSDKVSSADIRAALIKHFAPPGYRVFFEVSSETGASAGRRIDAIATGIWPSNGHEIIGIEIKVSRSDWLREIKDPAKAHALMRYCNRWYLACPDGLVRPDELPATWGLLSLKSGAIRSRVKAPKLDPAPITAAFMMAILRGANGIDQEVVDRLVNERSSAIQANCDARLKREISNLEKSRDTMRVRALEVAAKLREMTGEDPANWAFDVAALSAAYHFLKKSGLHSDFSSGVMCIPAVISLLGRAQESLGQIHSAFSDLRATGGVADV